MCCKTILYNRRQSRWFEEAINKVKSPLSLFSLFSLLSSGYCPPSTVPPRQPPVGPQATPGLGAITPWYQRPWQVLKMEVNKPGCCNVPCMRWCPAWNSGRSNRREVPASTNNRCRSSTLQFGHPHVQLGVTDTSSHWRWTCSPCSREGVADFASPWHLASLLSG